MLHKQCVYHSTHIRNHTLYCKPSSPRNLGRVHLALTGFNRSLYRIKTWRHFCTSLGQTNCFASLTLANQCHCSDTMATWNPIFQDSRSTALVHTGAGRLFQPLSLVDHLKSGDCGWTIRSTTGYWLGLTSIKYPDLITEQQFRTIQGRRSRGNQRPHRHVCVCHSVKQSLSSEDSKSSATQEIPLVLWNSEVHYRVHNSPSFIPILRGGNHCNPHPLSLFFEDTL